MTEQVTSRPAEVTRTTVRDVLADELLACFGITVQDDQEMIADVFLQRLWPLIEAWGAEQPVCVWGAANDYVDCAGPATPEQAGVQHRVFCEIHLGEIEAGHGPEWLEARTVEYETHEFVPISTVYKPIGLLYRPMAEDLCVTCGQPKAVCALGQT